MKLNEVHEASNDTIKQKRDRKRETERERQRQRQRQSERVRKYQQTERQRDRQAKRQNEANERPTIAKLPLNRCARVSMRACV